MRTVSEGRTENASMENLRNGGWIMQVRKSQVLICGVENKYENVKRVYYVFPLACLTLN